MQLLCCCKRKSFRNAATLNTEMGNDTRAEGGSIEGEQRREARGRKRENIGVRIEVPTAAIAVTIGIAAPRSVEA